jgi:hypothetical protein
MAAPTMFPVPPDARRAAHKVLTPGSAEQDYFWLKAAYPATPALDHYSRVFAAWVPCKPLEADWSGFGDWQGSMFFHQFTRHWVSADNKQAVTVLFQYTSPGTKHRAQPDNNNQLVAVVRHRVPDAAAFFGESRIECPKAPQR